jgi:hypothetical protein
MSERRSAFRWQISQQARVKLEGAPDFIHCQIKDINLKGLRISSALKLAKDAFSKFNLFLDEGCILNIEAWVVWHKTIGDLNSYGLYFTRVKDMDKEKIYRFVQQSHPEQIKKQYCQGLREEGGEIMPKSSIEDRRIFARFGTKFPLRFLDLNSNREGIAQTQDLSAKGVGLLVNEELPARTPVEMWLKIPDKGEPLYTRGEVVWSKMVGPNEYRTGVNLDKADLMGLSRALRAI